MEGLGLENILWGSVHLSRGLYWFMGWCCRGYPPAIDPLQGRNPHSTLPDSQRHPGRIGHGHLSTATLNQL